MAAPVKRARVDAPLAGPSIQLTPPPTPAHPLPPTISQIAVRPTNICKSCNTKFASNEALDFHIKLKTKALSKVRVEKSSFKAASQMLVCHFLDCCYTSESIHSMTQHLTSGKHGSKRYMVTSGLVKQTNGGFEPSEIYVIPRGPLPRSSKAFTCPTCGEQLSSKDSFDNHIKYSCRGVAPWACPHCALQCRGRQQVTDHMRAKHPLPGGLNLTGVYAGQTKKRKVIGKDQYEPRKGKIKGGADLRNVQAFTFLAPKATCLTAEEIFDDSQRQNLRFLIDQARGGHGVFSLNVNTGSLLFTSNSKRLELFNTQCPMQVYSSTSDPEMIVKKILSLVDTAAHQAADASSGLSLHTIKCVTICLAARSGQRGAGTQGKTTSPYPSTLNWSNARRVRGTISLQLTAEEVKQDPSRQLKCFQYSILHNLFYSEVKQKLKADQEEKCAKERHWKGETDSMCKICLRLWEKSTSNKVLRTRGSVIPLTARASTYDPYVDRLNWTGVCFPAGHFPSLFSHFVLLLSAFLNFIFAFYICRSRGLQDLLQPKFSHPTPCLPRAS